MAKRSQGATPREAAVSRGRGVAPSYLTVPLDKLLEPVRPARMTMDETKLYELVESIREIGLIEPLCVSIEGDNYRVQAGHRRLLACRALNMPLVPCVLTSAGRDAALAIMLHENARREDLSPAEEGLWFTELLETVAGGDCDALVDMLKSNRQYVEDRLNLVRGDKAIFQALTDGLIGVRVAQELNMLRDPGRRAMYLDAAARGGATVAMVHQWRVQGNAMDEVDPASALPAADPDQAQPVSTAAPSSAMSCYFCNSSEDPHELVVLWAHKSCKRMVERNAEAAQ